MEFVSTNNNISSIIKTTTYLAVNFAFSGRARRILQPSIWNRIAAFKDPAERCHPRLPTGFLRFLFCVCVLRWGLIYLYTWRLLERSDTAELTIQSVFLLLFGIQLFTVVVVVFLTAAFRYISRHSHRVFFVVAWSSSYLTWLIKKPR